MQSWPSNAHLQNCSDTVKLLYRLTAKILMWKSRVQIHFGSSFWLKSFALPPKDRLATWLGCTPTLRNSDPVNSKGIQLLQKMDDCFALSHRNRMENCWRCVWNHCVDLFVKICLENMADVQHFRNRRVETLQLKGETKLPCNGFRNFP